MENDESKQKYIILCNLICLATICGLTIVGLLLLCFTRNVSGGIAAVVVAQAFFFPIYLNERGHALLAKVFTIQFANSMIIVMACIYSHETFLPNYYFPTVTSACFLFSYEQRKWLFVCVLSTLGGYVIEGTSLRYYLPAYNLGKDVGTSNIILLMGNIIVIVLDVFAYIYITKQRENQLVAKQKIILETQALLELQNEDLQTFSAAASHSLQTPLHILKYFFQAHVRLWEAPKKEHMEIIESSLDQMDQLVTGLFSYNHILHMDEEYSFFNVMSELELIKKRMELKFPAGRVRIPGGMLLVRTNRMLFSIIIHNLADNGLKYNIAETPSLSIEVEQTETTFSTTVSDNGIGIDERHFIRIFEPFRRIDTGNGMPGNGLGLAGAKRAAERLGGKLFCKKSSRAGSLFRLELPRLDG